MLFNCKEMITTPNDDFTDKIEFIGCKFMNNGIEIEGNITFPRVAKRTKDSFECYPIEGNSEIFTVYIPE